MVTKIDVKYLDLLSALHYVLGGLLALVSGIPLIQVVIGAAIASVSSDAGVAPGTFAGVFMAVLGVIIVLIGWTAAIGIIMVGVKLKRHKSRMFCIAMAAFECILFPIGTVLGVVTIFTLTREDVVRRFESPTYTHFASTHR